MIRRIPSGYYNCQIKKLQNQRTSKRRIQVGTKIIPEGTNSQRKGFARDEMKVDRSRREKCLDSWQRLFLGVSRISFVSIKVLTTGSCLSRPIPFGISAGLVRVAADDNCSGKERTGKTNSHEVVCFAPRQTTDIRTETRKLPGTRKRTKQWGCKDRRCRGEIFIAVDFL